MVIVSTTVSHGTAKGLNTVLGCSLAMAVQLTVCALLTGVAVQHAAGVLTWLRWLGVIYLFCLGISHLIRLMRIKHQDVDLRPGQLFQRGFIISLLNPKTLLFFSSFLPQFVAEGIDYMRQILILSFMFWIMALVSDSLYALCSGIVQKKMSKWGCLTAFNHGLSALLYMVAAIYLGRY